jgi:hypothetical protein
MSVLCDIVRISQPLRVLSHASEDCIGNVMIFFGRNRSSMANE